MTTETVPTPDPTPAASDAEVVLEVNDVKKYFPLTRGIVFQRTIGHVKG